MAQIDYKELKRNCFMKQSDKGSFSLRIGIIGGQIKAEQLLKVSEIADKYGRGYVHLTSRQSLEIPYIKLEDKEEVISELDKADLQPGVCGPRVRTITACQGSVICPSGLVDTTALAIEFDERYHGRELPHKFKMGITGCRNNCLKAEENDFGVKGAMKPEWNDENCTYCGLCEKICREKAIKVDSHTKKLTYDEKACNYCGRCVKACPQKSWRGTSGFAIYLGGLFGNRIAIGKQILPVVFSIEEVHKAAEAVMTFYTKHGKPGERFRNTLDRVGWELLQKDLEDALGHK